MGIDVGSKLFVGLPFYEVVEDEEQYYNSFSKGLERISPSYDAPSDECYLGIKLAGVDYDADEISIDNLPRMLVDARLKFFELTGKFGKLYVSPHVW